jgi:subtilisin family serine protease
MRAVHFSGWQAGQRSDAWRPDELLADPDGLPHLLPALRAGGLTGEGEPDVAGVSGLVRVPVTDLEAALTAARQAQVQVGRNRLLGVGRVELVTGQPKIAGNGMNSAEETRDEFPAREPGGAGDGVVVGVLDTGITPHPWLADSYLAGPHDRERLDVDPFDQQLDTMAGHGTFLAGLVLRNAPGATVRVERVLSSRGLADSQAVADAIDRLGGDGVHVVNLSLGCYTDDDKPPFALQRAIERLGEEVLVVASAGNYGSERRFFPAAIPGVVAVASAYEPLSGGWDLAPSSGFGGWVDLAAPGVQVLSTFVQFSGRGQHFRRWAYWSGTSFASAIVAGEIAGRIGDKTTPRQAADQLRAAPVPRTATGDLPVVGIDHTIRRAPR